MALAFAPLGFWPIIFVSIPLCYLLIDTAPHWRSGVFRGFAFGYGYFMAGTYWISNALLVDAEQFGWLVPFCALGLSALMALWFAVMGALFWWARTGHVADDVLRFTTVWVLVEIARSWGMFGFPWNLMGYIALESGRMSQFASLAGVYGLSAALVGLALVPVFFLHPLVRDGVRWRALAVALVVAIGLYAYGMARMTQAVDNTDTRIRVVQASIPQSMKWTDEGRADSLKKHLQLSKLHTDAPPDIIIWPETAFPYTLYPDSPWPARLSQLLPANTVLITGAVRGEDADGRIALWNSIMAIGSDGQIRQAYDKHQLVPFGEFVPFRSVLPLDKITPGAIDFSRGTGARTLTVDKLPSFSPLVCYEVIFPRLVVNRDHRPEWLLNVTNDAWYGDSAGPPQHFALARMRAIEQGLPLVRAANNGISAVIDPYGRIVRALPLNAHGIIEQRLPKPLEPTLYSSYCNGVILLILLCIWCIGTVLRKRESSLPH